jgi:hypothetical protein
MRRIMRAKILFIAISATVVLADVPLAPAHPVSDPAPPQIVPAPVPIQILTGKRVFISNGVSTAVTDVPNLPYNEFYGYMKAWGRYELASTPADADLVFELRFVNDPPRAYLELRLAIRDPKTRTVLWSFIDSVSDASREATRRKNFDQAMAKLVQEVKALTAPPATAPAAPGTNK